MDELSAAIEAAAAAAAASSQSPPKSPEIKMEPKHEAPLPELASTSPLKRARLPLDDAGPADEKRQKINGEEVPPPESLAPQPEPRAEAESRTASEPIAAAQIMSQPEPEAKPASLPEIEAEVLPQPEPKVETLPDVQPAVDEVVSQTQLEQEPAPQQEPEPQQEQESNPMADISEGLADLDEITKMIQAAQEAALGTDGVPEDHPMPDFHAEVNDLTGDHGHDIDINSIMASIASSLENGGNGDIHGDSSHDIHTGALPLPDLTTTAQVTPKRASIWSHRAQYTRQTYILPTLGKVAVDILIALCDQELEETITCLNDPDNGHSVGKEYAVLRSFFDALRKQLSEDFPLLYPEQLDISSAEDREIIRIANLATSCASMFGANELGWPDLNASFLSTFVADGQQMPSDEAELYLGLKTQMFLTLLESEQSKPRVQILEELFVSGQEDALRKHHPGVPLALSETKFLADAEARKTMLLNESHDSASIQALSTQYTYESFLEELSGYLSRHMTNIEKLGSSPTSVSTDAESSGLFDGISGLDNFDIDAAIAEAAKAAQEASEDNGTTNISDDIAALISFASEQAQGQSLPSEMPPTVLSTSESAMRATNLALQTMQRNQYHPTTVQQANNSSPNGHHSSHQSQQPSQQPTQQQQYYAYPQQPNTPVQQAQTSDRPELPPGQHASSEILYERARQAAAARSSTHARREGSHSTRRPWSPEEEKALMMGLDMVKGPHWSQILSLFGQQGRMSNILADRTQVQLKDKARNLKLFFLKTNSEMPYYLQCVTGELKTRAPTQAARKEAEERARLTSEDEKAHISATMALGNMHNGNGQRPQPKPSPSKSGIPAQIAAHSQSLPGSPHATQLQRTSSGHGSGAASTQSSLPNGQHVQLAQAAQKPQVPLQPQQHVQQMQQVAPRPTPQTQSHVPLKPHHQHSPLQQQPAIQPQVSHQQNMQNQQRQAAPQHHQPHLQPHHQQKSVHQQSQLQSPMQPQHTPAQAQPQSQQNSQALPQASTTHTPVPPKTEDSAVKHEPLNEEEAGLMELKRFMSQENSVDQDQSLEAALAAASAAAAAAVTAQSAT